MNLGRSTKRVLLTGAGISKNWGGKLASELWSDLIGSAGVRAHPRVRQLLLDEPSFEVALARCRTEDFSESEQSALEQAVLNAFITMDRQIADNQYQPYGWIDIYRVQRFLGRFCWNQDRTANTSFLFTLNQDLLLERRWYNFDHHRPPSLPGVPPPRLQISTNQTWFSSIAAPYGDDQVSFVGWNGEPTLAGCTNYIKLHGSFNWVNADGSRTMVVGSRKAQQISSHPLLNWYFEVFRNVLCEGDVRLMVIGYSFSDDHINEVIAKAVREHGLQVFVWDVGFSGLRDKLSQTEDGRTIYGSLISSCQQPMIEVFPSNQIDTQEYLRIQADFF